jgi:hypothetical protein
MCFFKSKLRQNPLPHSSHVNGCKRLVGKQSSTDDHVEIVPQAHVLVWFYFFLFLHAARISGSHPIIYYCTYFFVLMRVQMKTEIVRLMKRFLTNTAFVSFDTAVCQLVILVVAILMKSFAANIAHVRLVA